VHALDAAVLFRLALERAEAGTSWHAVADEGDQVRDIAAVIGRPRPTARSAGSRSTRAFSRIWRTSSPDQHTVARASATLPERQRPAAGIAATARDPGLR
jgi:hypothetical protein